MPGLVPLVVDVVSVREDVPVISLLLVSLVGSRGGGSDVTLRRFEWSLSVLVWGGGGGWEGGCDWETVLVLVRSIEDEADDCVTVREREELTHKYMCMYMYIQYMCMYMHTLYSIYMAVLTVWITLWQGIQAGVRGHHRGLSVSLKSSVGGFHSLFLSLHL